VAINLGAGSAVGLLGMTFSYLPLPVLESEIGVGLGYTGWQFSAMQKVALGWARPVSSPALAAPTRPVPTSPSSATMMGSATSGSILISLGSRSGQGAISSSSLPPVAPTNLESQSTSSLCPLTVRIQQTRAGPQQRLRPVSHGLADGSSRCMAPQHWPVVELAIESASKVHVSGERVDPVEVNSLRIPRL